MYTETVHCCDSGRLAKHWSLFSSVDLGRFLYLCKCTLGVVAVQIISVSCPGEIIREEKS